MIIKLKHNFFVEVDEKNFTLKSEYTNKKTKEKATRTHGYYSSLGCAIKNYIKLVNLDDGHTYELTELLKKIEEVCDETISLWNKRTINDFKENEYER